MSDIAICVNADGQSRANMSVRRRAAAPNTSTSNELEVMHSDGGGRHALRGRGNRRGRGGRRRHVASGPAQACD